jgi:hypothetical protein
VDFHLARLCSLIVKQDNIIGGMQILVPDIKFDSSIAEAALDREWKDTPKAGIAASRHLLTLAPNDPISIRNARNFTLTIAFILLHLQSESEGTVV